MMFRFFVILFLIVPLLEIFLLIKVGGLIGALWTVILVVLTAVTGVALLRIQGMQTIYRLRESAARGEAPAIPMIEGAFLLFAGALLLTPGFFTDALGFALLVPSLRQYLAQQILRRGVWMAVNAQRGGARPDSPASEHPRTYDGEYQKKDD